MGQLPCIAVARRAPYRTQRGRGVFALVVRCWVIRLLLYYRIGKNRDTKVGEPASAGQPMPPLLICRGSRDLFAAWKPMTYTDLLCVELLVLLSP
jgi:hypothetical protein